MDLLIQIYSKSLQSLRATSAYCSWKTAPILPWHKYMELCIWTHVWRVPPMESAPLTESCPTTPNCFQQNLTTQVTNGWSHHRLVTESCSPHDRFSLGWLSGSGNTWKWGLVSARTSPLPQRDVMLSFKIFNWSFKSVYKRGRGFMRKSNPALVPFPS